MREIEETPFYSLKVGDLPKGCQMCVKGEKLVLYITGICPRKCWFCPLSDKRKDKDVIFVNEWETNSKENLITEVKLGQAKGCGITGGDPLSRLSRTIEYIKLLKEKFGKEFHIHLYTSLDLVTIESMQELYNAGLDEIRFHFDLESDKLWDRINLARSFDWDIGVEIPCIPEKEEEIYELCDFLEGKVKFLNLNEFEISDLNSEEMYAHGYEEINDISHGIEGSSEIGRNILFYCQDKDFNVHFCTSKLKDKVQMQNRFKLRAENVKTDFDIISDEGLLIRGVIYLKDFGIKEFKSKNTVTRDNSTSTRSVQFLSKDKNNFDRNEVLAKLEEVRNMLDEEGLDVIVDEKKLRLLSYPEHIEQFAQSLKSLDLVPAIVEEDPTVEAFEVNIDYL